MFTHKDLIRTLKTELLTDPEHLGYSRYFAYPAQIAALMNQPQRQSEIQSTSITKALEYLTWLEELKVVNNVQLVKELVEFLIYHGAGNAVNNTVATEESDGLLRILKLLGIDFFLNMFGISSYWGDKEKLKMAVLDVLEHASKIGQKKYSVHISNKIISCRILRLFSGVAGAPNAVTEKDIIDTKHYANII